MASDEPGQDPFRTPEDARLESLEQRLAKAKAEEAKRTGRTAPTSDASEQLGQRVLSTLIGGLVGGALFGWLFDKWLGTGHLLLVVMMVLGTVAAFWSIFKLVNRRP